MAGATLLGLSMFATLFLGAILAVFLTLGAVRGDAERGLLQPLLVRPLSRGTFLLGRFVAAAGVCAVYVIVVFLAVGGDHGRLHRVVAGPGDRARAGAGGGGAVIAALALAGSVVLSSTANGIAVFMIFGAGLTAGLLGQIAEALSSDTLGNVSKVATWVMPFEALYQSALSSVTADTVGYTRFAIDLGPFGGAQSTGALLYPYAALYTAAVGAAAWWAFRRRDL